MSIGSVHWENSTQQQFIETDGGIVALIVGGRVIIGGAFFLGLCVCASVC
jgi:hypothetical protein